MLPPCTRHTQQNCSASFLLVTKSRRCHCRHGALQMRMQADRKCSRQHARCPHPICEVGDCGSSVLRWKMFLWFAPVEEGNVAAEAAQPYGSHCTGAEGRDLPAEWRRCRLGLPSFEAWLLAGDGGSACSATLPTSGRSCARPSFPAAEVRGKFSAVLLQSCSKFRRQRRLLDDVTDKPKFSWGSLGSLKGRQVHAHSVC